MGTGRARPLGAGMIFISYAREDAAAAAKLVGELAERGLPCLIDPPLPHSDPFWRNRLAQQMVDCSLLVALQSPYADASPWVQQERRGFRGANCAVQLAGASISITDGGVNTLPNDAVSTIAALWRGPRGACVAAAVAPPPPDHRQRLWRQAQAHLETWLAAPRPAARPAFDGRRAWLAGGRIELQRDPSASEPVYIATQPLSNALYREFFAQAGFDAPPTWGHAGFDAADAPVTGITWFEASACAAWFGGQLPSEVSWAWAAQSGDLAWRFATATGDLRPELAHFAAAFGSGAPREATAHPPNAAGCFGMCGNTWDWCADAWGPHRALRGGGWMDDETFCTVGARYRNAPIDRDCTVGMRIALPAPH